MARHHGGYPVGASAFYDRAIAPGTARAVAPALEDLAASLEPAAAVLDVGCGGGQGLLALAVRRPDLELTGLDASPDLLRRARARAGSAPAALQLVDGTALDLPFASGSFDAVVSFFAVKHWPDRPRGVQECARVLRPGGHLLIAELDRAATLDRWRAFVDLTDLPAAARPIYARATRRPFLGRALTAVELGGLLSGAPVTGTVSLPDHRLAMVTARARRL